MESNLRAELSIPDPRSTFSLNSIVQQDHRENLMVSISSLNEDGENKTFFYEVKLQNLIFDQKPCRVLTLHDVTKKHENDKLRASNKLIQLLSSSCNHEMLAPIRCVIQIT